MTAFLLGILFSAITLVALVLYVFRFDLLHSEIDEYWEDE